MFDFTGLLDDTTKVFVYNAPGGANDWVMWEKPAGCVLVHILCIGAGGGGGGGRTNTVVTNRGGGGGGAGGDHCMATYPAFFLPDNLYVKVGTGGIGGTAGSNGAAGTQSQACVYPVSSLENRVCISGNTTADFGDGATGAAGGAAGAAGAVSTISTGAFLGLGNFFSVAGRAGGAGGASSAAGTNVNALSGAVTSPGAGGGGTDLVNTNRDGGSVFATADILDNQVGGTGAGGAGLPGMNLRKPLLFLGGSGGASNGLGTGGKGGDGGTGSGGGGGGSGVTGGAGGKGGDGLIIIIAK